jgi:hypothetical protein
VKSTCALGCVPQLGSQWFKVSHDAGRVCAQVDALVERFRRWCRWCRWLDVPWHEDDSQIRQLSAGSAFRASGTRRVHLSQRRSRGRA